VYTLSFYIRDNIYILYCLQKGLFQGFKLLSIIYIGFADLYLISFLTSERRVLSKCVPVRVCVLGNQTYMYTLDMLDASGRVIAYHVYHESTSRHRDVYNK